MEGEPANSEAAQQEPEKEQQKRKNFLDEEPHNVFVDGLNMHGKKVRPEIIETYTKYYRV